MDTDEICWFVEAWFNNKSDGWFTAPSFGAGGWSTIDPQKAKRYTKSEAEAVAHALTYFNCPFRWSKWIATEHIFVSPYPISAFDEPAKVPDTDEVAALKARVELCRAFTGLVCEERDALKADWRKLREGIEALHPHFQGTLDAIDRQRAAYMDCKHDVLTLMDSITEPSEKDGK